MASSKNRNKSSRGDTSSGNGPIGPAQVPVVEEIAAVRTNVAERSAERIGDVLRRTREKRGDDLYRIAEYLCIKPNLLVALEDSDYDTFPADAYVIGFLRSYANYLGLDGKEAIDRYRKEMAGRRKKPVLNMPEPISGGQSPTVLIVVAGVLFAILTYVAWYSLTPTDRAVVNVPPPLPTGKEQVAKIEADTSKKIDLTVAPSPIADITLSAPASVATVPGAQGMPSAAGVLTTPAPENFTTSQQPVQQPKARVVIRAIQPSWVLVTDAKGRTVFDKVLKVGETYAVPQQKGLNLTTGNGSGVVIVLDGNDLPTLAAGASQVVRNIPLDADKVRDAAERGE